jgi:flagellar biosynthesis/type III secretory pathway protein FliH
MMALMLVEEERNSSNLKALLQITHERLETEMRRADAAESRATLAEARVREATSRIAVVEQGLHRSELDAARAEEETKRARMQLETVERELRRVTSEMQRLARQKEEADNAAAKARDLARRWQSALRDYQAHDEGRQEGIRLALIRRYDDGREDGWEEGRNEGWEDGREEGFLEGRRAGYEEGRESLREERAERRVAPAAVQVVHRNIPHSGRRDALRYVEDHSEPQVIPIPESLHRVSQGRSEVRNVVLVIFFHKGHGAEQRVVMRLQSLERTRTWVESVGADESIRSHSPRVRPTWLGRRMTPETYPDDELP